MSDSVPLSPGVRPADSPTFPPARVLAGGAGLSLVGQLGAAGFSFIAAPLTARALGPQAFGIYRIALAVTSVAAVVATGGLQTALLILIPRRAGQDGGTETLRAATRYALVASLLLTAAVLVLRQGIGRLLGEPQLAAVLSVMMFSVPCLAVLTTARAGARAAFAFPEATIPSDLVRPGLFVVLVAAALAAAWSVTAESIAWMYTLSAAAAVGLAVAAVARLPQYRGRLLAGGIPRDPAILWLAAPMFVIEAVQMLNEWVMTFVLGVTAGASAVALYTAAQRTAALVALVLVAVNAAAAPAIAALWAAGRRDQLAVVTREATRWTLIASLAVALAVGAGGGAVLRLFGDSFQAAAPALAILAAGQLVNAGTGPVGYLLVLTGRQRLVAWNLLGAMVALVCGGVAGARLAGVTGAAIAAAAVMALVNLLMAYQVRRILGIVPWDARAGRVVLAGAAAVVAAVMTSWAPRASSPGAALQAVAVVEIAYAAALVAVATRRDREALGAWWRGRKVMRRASR